MFNVGIVGMGRVGYSHFKSLRLLEAEGYIKLVSVCDVRKLPKLVYELVKVYTDFELMLKIEKLDVLWICSPDVLHEYHAKSALNVGINVFIEKPIAWTYNTALSIYNIARDNCLSVYVGFNRRWLGEELKKEVNGKQIYQAVYFFTRPSLIYRTITRDLIHGIDFLLYLCGEGKYPISIKANIAPISSPEYEENVLASFKFANSSIGTLVGCHGKVKFKEFAIVFANDKILHFYDFANSRVTSGYCEDKNFILSLLGEEDQLVDKSTVLKVLSAIDAIRKSGSIASIESDEQKFDLSDKWIVTCPKCNKFVNFKSGKCGFCNASLKNQDKFRKIPKCRI